MKKWWCLFLAVLLAFSLKDNDALIEDMEACYQKLKEIRFSDGNSVQTASHVLALADSAQAPVRRGDRLGTASLTNTLYFPTRERRLSMIQALRGARA